MTAGGGHGGRAPADARSGRAPADARTGHGGAGRRSRPPLLWLTRVAGRRARVQWRLLAVVGVVALLVSTLVATLTLLVSTTEGTAVRETLADPPAGRTDVALRIENPRLPLAELRAATDVTVGRLLGADVAAVVQAASPLAYAPREGRGEALIYLGEYDGVRQQAELVDGGWPDDASPDAVPDAVPGAVPVAVPEAGLEALGVEVGDAIRLVSIDGEHDPVDLTVVGTYRATNPGARLWTTDRLGGEGRVDDHTVPGSAGFLRTAAVGPLLVAPGTLDAVDVGLGATHLRYTPDLSRATAADLAALQGRFAAADADVPRELASVGSTVSLTSDLDRFAREVTTAVLVTRAGVSVAGLLLLLLAVAALLQTARLLADARSVEHDLMRARGAADRQVLGVAAVEAAGVMLLTGAGGPLLAPWAYRALLAARGLDDVARTAPTQAPPLTWVTGAVVGLVLAAVLLAPLLRSPDTFVEGQQARGRDRRAMLARSGFDVLVVALAAVAYAQLRSYRSPLSGRGASLDLDPVLVAGPAVVLLAGALLCVRLLPPVARFTERLAARGRGLVGPLAAWEVGRRSSRATAAVLLLTLALAVSTYSQTFLATWHASQGDQAEFAVGAPVRVVDEPGATGRQVAALASDVAGTAQPTFRTTTAEGSVGKYDIAADLGQRAVAGRGAEVLGLTAEARAMLDRGRLAEGAGGTIAAMPSPELTGEPGVDLGADVAGISLVLEARSSGVPLSRSGVSVRVIVQDGAGVYSVRDAGFAFLDAGPRRLDVLLDGPGAAVGEQAADDAARRQYPLRLVGAFVLLGSAEVGEASGTFDGETFTDRFAVDVRITGLAALRPGTPPADEPSIEEQLAAWDGAGPMPSAPPAGLVRDQLAVPSDAWTDWTGSAINAQVGSLGDPVADGVGFRMSGPAVDIVRSPASVTMLTWFPRTPSPAVVSRALAERLDAEVGSRLLVGIPGGRVVVDVHAIVDRVPTTRSRDAVVLDYDTLARAVAEAAVVGSPVHEWWVDVPPESVEVYLAGLPPAADGSQVADRATAMTHEAAALREGPLRVATPIALWLVTAGAALVAGVGFAVHAAVTLRSREVEFAQLRAVGLQRRRLTGVVAVESLLLWLLGVVFGTGVGLALGWLVGPLVAVSADGAPPVPPVVVHVPWAPVLVVVAGLGVLVGAVVLVVARGQRAADPASVLREERAR